MLLVSQDVRLSRALALDGVHLTSRQLHLLQRLKRRAIVSTHDERELAFARRHRAQAATFSPIFATPGKGVPKGLRRLRKVATRYPLIALGGIVTERHVVRIERTGAMGFASIRYFVQGLWQS